MGTIHIYQAGADRTPALVGTVKHTTPSLHFMDGNVERMVPLVTDTGTVTTGGKVYSYDATKYPRFHCRYGGQTYHMVNSSKSSSIAMTSVIVQCYASDDDSNLAAPSANTQSFSRDMLMYTVTTSRSGYTFKRQVSGDYGYLVIRLTTNTADANTNNFMDNFVPTGMKFGIVEGTRNSGDQLELWDEVRMPYQLYKYRRVRGTGNQRDLYIAQIIPVPSYYTDRAESAPYAAPIPYPFWYNGFNFCAYVNGTLDGREMSFNLYKRHNPDSLNQETAINAEYTTNTGNRYPSIVYGEQTQYFIRDSLSITVS